jgi:hypothetical protein
MDNSFLQTSPYLASVRSVKAGLSDDERFLIVDQVRTVIRDYYVHLPLKMSSLGIDPVQEANLLADDIPYMSMEPDLEFFRRLLAIVKKLRDRHTCLRLPMPWANMVAFLPFTTESYWNPTSGRKLIVTKVFSGLNEGGFGPGVEITHWNGVPIRRYIEMLGWDTDGANPYARIALALRSLTARPLGYFLPPDEDWVNVSFIGFDGISRNAVFPWRVFVPSEGASSSTAGTEPRGDAGFVQGIDRKTATLNGAWLDLFAGAATTPANESGLRQVRVSEGLAKNLIAGVIESPYGEFAYVRLFSFEFADSEMFLREFSDVLRSLPKRAAILDVRGNPGGTIPSGEALLQLFSRHPVTPSPVCFRMTSATSRFVENKQIAMFQSWRRSFENRYEIGDYFSQAFSLTDPKLLSSQERVFHGPLVLIIDALCYSTTDFFASGVQDNGLGLIIGVDQSTGGGGANVWSHSLLAQIAMASGGRDLQTLPRGTEFNVSMRRSVRVGSNAGIPVEGLAVRVDDRDRYRYSMRDVLEKNADLMLYAAFRASQLS